MKKSVCFKMLGFCMVAFFLSVLAAGCDNSVGKDKGKKTPTTVEEVTITIDGDGNVKGGKGISFKVEKGKKWGQVKTRPEIQAVTFKDGFVILQWKLNNESGNELTDDYVFNANTTVFAVSKQTTTNITDEVTITIDGDGNVKGGKGTSFKVEKGKRWRQVKTRPEVKNITFNGEYSLDVWKLKDENGEELEDDYAFNSDQTIFAVSLLYVKVAYGQLANYLNEKGVESPRINYIEVTGVQVHHLMPEYPPVQPYQCSPLGAILNKYPFKMVALKLPEEIEGLSDMTLTFSKCVSLESLYAFPSGITNLENCFFKCEKLTKVPDIPEGVENMKGCFSGCSILEVAPSIPSSVKNMDSCFSSCIKLNKAPVIAEGVQDLDMSGCFWKCESLAEPPVIPEGVSTMLNCFNGCKKLTKSPVIPSTVKNMKFCFKECVELTKATNIPKDVKDVFGCFWKCEKLTEAPTIPEGVINLGACFIDCKSLVTGPTVPASVVNILQTFKGCEKLETVVLNGKCEANLRGAFKGCNSIQAGGIKVKSEHLEWYKSKASDMEITVDKLAAQQ